MQINKYILIILLHFCRTKHSYLWFRVLERGKKSYGSHLWRIPLHEETKKKLSAPTKFCEQTTYTDFHFNFSPKSGDEWMKVQTSRRVLMRKQTFLWFPSENRGWSLLRSQRIHIIIFLCIQFIFYLIESITNSGEHCTVVTLIQARILCS